MDDLVDIITGGLSADRQFPYNCPEFTLQCAAEEIMNLRNEVDRLNREVINLHEVILIGET